jgi:hypothetical protein
MMNGEVLWVRVDVRKREEEGEIINEMNICRIEKEIRIKPRK